MQSAQPALTTSVMANMTVANPLISANSPATSAIGMAWQTAVPLRRVLGAMDVLRSSAGMLCTSRSRISMTTAIILGVCAHRPMRNHRLLWQRVLVVQDLSAVPIYGCQRRRATTRQP
jgi:hypothetical protein